MSKFRILLLVAIVAAVGAFFLFDLGQYLTLDYFKSQQARIMAYYEANPWQVGVGFFVIYVIVTGLSLPGAAVMTLVAGAIFGLLWGTIIVSFASSIGATVAFLAARFLLRDWVQKNYRRRLKAINEGVEKDGAFYLFALRLVPAFPFFVINLAMALTPMKAVTFYIVSQVGMLAGTIVYVFAGTQIAQIESLGDILSPGLIGAFALLGLFPLIAKKVVDFLRARKAFRGYDKPRSFDNNVIVIGAGSAGLVASYIAATVKARVTLIEKAEMGGDCLNTGCVPSKALIRTARFVQQAREARSLGLKSASVDFDFAEVMDRVHRVIKTIEPHDSVERYEGLGVDVIKGEAKLTSPWTVEVNGETLTARNIILATGAEPLVPPIDGLDQVDYLTSENLWQLRELPERLVVLGGGPIGSEMTQAFARLGSQVTQVEMMDRIMGPEDPDIAALVQERFEAEGIDVRLNHKAKQVKQQDGRKLLVCETEEGDVQIEFDRILVAVGRKARLKGFGIEELGIRAERTIEVNDFLQTNFPNIYACGDAISPYQFTHTAAHEAWFASVNALFGMFKKFRADYSVIPWCTFTDPEVASVGLNETRAKEQEIEYEVTKFEMAELDRAIAEEARHGVVKVLTEPGKDRILGATIVGEHAGDMIIEYIQAMKQGFGLNKILGTIHPYPTLAEANKFAAGEWKKAHKPEWALDLVERFHRWRLG